MPKVVPNPNDRLWDSLVQSGRQTAGLAQQQTQVYQDWTRPDPKPIIPFFNPEGVAVSPDGKYAYVCNSDQYITYGANGSISKIDLTTRAVIDVFPAMSLGTPSYRMMPQYIAVSPDGTKLYWSSYNGDYALLFECDGWFGFGPVECGWGHTRSHRFEWYLRLFRSGQRRLVCGYRVQPYG